MCGLINRWDAVQKMEDRNSGVLKDELQVELGHISWAPVLYISALTGKGCHRILPAVREVFEAFNQRVPTGQLNKFLESAVENHSVPQRYHHPVRLNYMTQVRIRPPTFVIFSNTPRSKGATSGTLRIVSVRRTASRGRHKIQRARASAGRTC